MKLSDGDTPCYYFYQKLSAVKLWLALAYGMIKILSIIKISPASSRLPLSQQQSTQLPDELVADD